VIEVTMGRDHLMVTTTGKALTITMAINKGRPTATPTPRVHMTIATMGRDHLIAMIMGKAPATTMATRRGHPTATIMHKGHLKNLAIIEVMIG
jgi:hypothetical protein